MSDAILNLGERQIGDFVISKLDLMPEGVVAAPLGEVLLAGFDGNAAYAWIKHAPNEARVMNLLTLPTGGPFRLDTDPGFYPAAHACSFFKVMEGKIKMPGAQNRNHTSAWHVFAWYPLPESIPTVQ